MSPYPSFEILESLPTYGPMYVSIAEDGAGFYSEGFVIRFFKSDGTDWVANFQPGWTNFRTVIELANSKLLIIASGTCYIMHPDQQIPYSVFGVGYEAVLKTKNGIYILQDQTDLTLLDEFGNYSHSERISYDGIKELRLDENGLVHGLSYYPTSDADQWIPFTYDSEKRKLTGGSFGGNTPTKKWWKRL
jgi:hypothetical protein